MISKGKPRHISGVIERAVLFAGIKEKFDQYSIVPEWPNIAGAEFADISYPEKIVRGKTLVVKVLDPAWAQEMEFRKSELIDRIFKLKKGALIEDIRFIVVGPKDFQKK